MTTADIAKHNMIEQQIRPWEVIDNRVLSVIDRLDRADFVRESYKGLAYADCRIPIGGGACMLPPTIEGRILQALLIEPDDRALEVGSGSGYLSACLARLAQSVTSIDKRGEIVELASANVTGCGLDNVTFEQTGLDQLDKKLAYDVIAVTGSVAEVPENLRQALTPGGRLFVVVGESPAMQALLVTRVDESEWTTQSLFETDLPRLDR